MLGVSSRIELALTRQHRLAEVIENVGEQISSGTTIYDTGMTQQAIGFDSESTSNDDEMACKKNKWRRGRDSILNILLILKILLCMIFVGF